MLVSLYDVTGNFGIAIILLTFVIKLLTFPLTQKSYVSMQQMKILGPLMKDLQKKYGHDRTLLGQKQMEMYKETFFRLDHGSKPARRVSRVWVRLLAFRSGRTHVGPNAHATTSTRSTSDEIRHVGNANNVHIFHVRHAIWAIVVHDYQFASHSDAAALY